MTCHGCERGDIVHSWRQGQLQERRAGVGLVCYYSSGDYRSREEGGEAEVEKAEKKNGKKEEDGIPYCRANLGTNGICAGSWEKYSTSGIEEWRDLGV